MMSYIFFLGSLAYLTLGFDTGCPLINAGHDAFRVVLLSVQNALLPGRDPQYVFWGVT